VTNTPRIGIPYLQAAQAQKEVTHNEALRIIDLVSAPAVDGLLVDQPPVSPAVGACYIVGTTPQDAWAGHAETLAGYGDGGWRFLAPIEGLTVLDKNSGQFATFVGGSWEVGALRAEAVLIDGEQVVGPRLAAIADPTGGAVIDMQARAAITAILASLRQHGLIDS
jgi:hypothetical protein